MSVYKKVTIRSQHIPFTVWLYHQTLQCRWEPPVKICLAYFPPKNQSASSSFKYFLPELPWWLNGHDYLLAIQETQVQPWFEKIPWRREWLPTSSILARRIPWTEEPCRPQSMGSQRVRHASVTAWVVFTFILSLPQCTRSLTRGPHSNLQVNFTFQFERGSYYVVINFNTVSASITDQY